MNIKHPFPPSSLFSLFPPPGIFIYTNEKFYLKLRKDLKMSLNICLQIFWCLLNRSCAPSYIPREFTKSKHKYEELCFNSKEYLLRIYTELNNSPWNDRKERNLGLENSVSKKWNITSALFLLPNLLLWRLELQRKSKEMWY